MLSLCCFVGLLIYGFVELLFCYVDDLLCCCVVFVRLRVFVWLFACLFRWLVGWLVGLLSVCLCVCCDVVFLCYCGGVVL